MCAHFCSLAIESPPTSNANLDGLSEDGRFATYSCDSALYELEGSTSIGYDEENGWPDAPACKGMCVCFVVVFVLCVSMSLCVCVFVCVRVREHEHECERECVRVHVRVRVRVRVPVRVPVRVCNRKGIQ